MKGKLAWPGGTLPPSLPGEVRYCFPGWFCPSSGCLDLPGRMDPWECCQGTSGIGISTPESVRIQNPQWGCHSNMSWLLGMIGRTQPRLLQWPGGVELNSSCLNKGRQGWALPNRRPCRQSPAKTRPCSGYRRDSISYFYRKRFAPCWSSCSGRPIGKIGSVPGRTLGPISWFRPGWRPL